jgi:hypothetical protein
MKKLFFDNKINILFLITSIICLVGVLGIENISFKNSKWLYDTNNDASLHQLGWHFFKNDIWRFPLGNNPNYGDEIGNSIVYTDSIPFLALFFKLFKSFIPGNFQYFSFWYLICFYLQLFFSFKILKKFTNSDSHSLIGSLFFLIAPIFVFRVNWHAAGAGHWILLFTLYLILMKKVDKTKLQWIFIIIFSSLVNYSFTALILVVYSFLRVLNLKFNKQIIFKFLKDFILIFLLLILVLYIVGYFEVRPADTLGVGFGYYKLNLLSIFDPINSADNISWSWFLPDIKLSRGEELEGFNYLGLGCMMMLIFALILLFNNKYKSKIFEVRNNREVKFFIIISVFLTLWALSNEIAFGSYTLLKIPLNKYIFGVLSIAKNTGRYFWIVNYFLLMMSIVIIFKCFSNKNSLLIITLFLVVQIADTSAGIKQRINLFAPLDKESILKDRIWNDLFKKYSIVKTTYPISWSKFFSSFAYAIESNNVEKTNIVALARMNRRKAAESRYALYNNFKTKNLSPDTVYLIDQAHIILLKHLFQNENVGFFYRDNFWAMVMNEKDLMNDNDKLKFNDISFKLLEFNKKIDLNFAKKNNYYGFGWSHNFHKYGIWSEGLISTLLFKTKKNYSDLKLEIICKPYITKKNNIVEFDVFVNEIFNKNIKLSNKNNDQKIEILIDKKLLKNNEIKVDFNFKNLVSPYEVFESPDSRKLGILVKSIKINPI